MSQMRRWTMAISGVTCVVLGAVGVVLPGMPTTIFLIAAVYFLTRSYPALERRLVRNRFFARFLPYVDGKIRLSTRAKLAVIAVMWISVSISCLGIAYAGAISTWMLTLILGLAAIGSLVVWFR